MDNEHLPDIMALKRAVYSLLFSLSLYSREITDDFEDCPLLPQLSTMIDNARLYIDYLEEQYPTNPSL